MYNMKCVGEMSSPVPLRACTVTAVDRYSFSQKFLRQGCGGERTIARACVLRLPLAYAWLLRARAVAHVPTFSPPHMSIITLWCTVHRQQNALFLSSVAFFLRLR